MTNHAFNLTLTTAFERIECLQSVCRRLGFAAKADILALALLDKVVTSIFLAIPLAGSNGRHD